MFSKCVSEWNGEEKCKEEIVPEGPVKKRTKKMDTPSFKPEEFRMVCKTCDYKTINEELFQEHCSSHYHKGEDRVDMKCCSCGFESKSVITFSNHLRKKRHKMCYYYVSHMQYFFGDEEMVREATFHKFGYRNTEKVCLSLSSKRIAEECKNSTE